MGRIASLIVALVVLTGQQPLRSQSKGSANGFDLVDNTGNIRKPVDFRDLYQALGVIHRSISTTTPNALHVRVAGHSGVLPQDWEVCGWNRISERGLCN